MLNILKIRKTKNAKRSKVGVNEKRGLKNLYKFDLGYA